MKGHLNDDLGYDPIWLNGWRRERRDRGVGSKNQVRRGLLRTGIGPAVFTVCS